MQICLFCRLSEERRRKLQDLERELQESRKSLREMGKMEKLKVQSDANVKKLREEIQVSSEQ